MNNPTSPIETAVLGRDTGRGNLVGVQPVMRIQDYASETAFAGKINSYLAVAREKGWLNPRSIVVFPEYMGTWLVAADEKPAAYRAGTIQSAMQQLVLGHPFDFAGKFMASHEKERLTASLFRLKAAIMARIYQAVFSRLAREYAVTIVAGSLLLPEPRIDAGRLAIGEGLLYNASVVYDPSGLALAPICRKAFPIPEEQPFTTSASVEDIPAYETPAGRLGVLICADAWIPACHARLKAQPVDFLVVPSYLMGAEIWDKPWNGYTVGEDAGDPSYPAEGLTEGQAWRKYVLPGRLADSGAKYGLNVFIRGQFWELGADGRSIGVGREGVIESRSDMDALLNLWLS